MMGGVCATDIRPELLRDFLAEFASDGFILQPVFSRDEYLTFTKDMPMWHCPQVSEGENG
jgi:hypothetical protein